MTAISDIPIHAGLTEALALLARRQGRSASAEGIAHGLAHVRGRLSPICLHEAAARAGFMLADIERLQSQGQGGPLLLTRGDGTAAIVAAIEADGFATAVTPANEDVRVLTARLVAAGFGSGWSVRPLSHRDHRTGLSGPEGFGWFLAALRLGGETMAPLILATAVINVLALAVPLISMNVLDRVVAHAAFETLWALALGGLVAVGFDFTLRMLRATLIDHASGRGDVVLTNRIFGRVLGARLEAARSSIGVRSNSLREYESLREIYNSAALATFGDLPFAVLFLFVIWLVAGPIVIVPLLVAPILLAVGYFTQRRLSGLSAEHLKDVAHKNAVAVEVLAGLETLKAHAAESWAAAKWEAAVAGHIRHSIAMRWWTALSGNAVIALQGITTLAILVAGVYLVVAGTISPGALFAATMLAGRSLTPVTQLAGLLAKLHQAKAAYGAIRQLADVEQERGEGREMLPAPASFGALALGNVTLAYRKGEAPALKGVTITIRPGEKVGILGGIGSGKSTLLRVMLGLSRPTSGTVTMAGLPVQQIDPAQYRRLFGVALQEEALFFGTIHENIAFLNPAVSEAGLVAAARESGALNWITALPAGFAAVVEEGGRNLSGGQRQTLMLARAFASRAAALLLDEPTSALDSRSEADIVRRLKELPATVTLIAVSHRPAVLDACQRLIVMDQGQVVMDGEKKVVLARLKQAAVSQRRGEEAKA